MKIILITLVLLTIGTASFAQTGMASVTDVSRSDVSRSDVSAIKKVIEDEVDYNRQRNLEKWLNCYAKVDDLVFGFVPGMVRGYEQAAKGAKAGIEKNPQPEKNTGVISDYRIRQQGTTAFVSCIQIETAPDGTQTKWNKALYLEKLNGEWKIIGNLFSSEPIKKS